MYLAIRSIEPLHVLNLDPLLNIFLEKIIYFQCPEICLPVYCKEELEHSYSRKDDFEYVANVALEASICYIYPLDKTWNKKERVVGEKEKLLSEAHKLRFECA